MTRIVRTPYRYKRRPKKRKPNPVALAMPKIFHAKKPKPGRAPIAGKSSRHRDPNGQMAAEVNLSTFPSEAQAQSRRRETAVNTAENSHLPKEERRSAIVTIRNRKHARSADVPDMTPEEHKRRGDAAETLFREVTRRIGEKVRSSYHATITIPCQSPSKMLAPLRCSPVARGIGTPNLEPPLLPVRGGGPFARAYRRVPVVVSAHRVRPLRQGPDAETRAMHPTGSGRRHFVC